MLSFKKNGEGRIEIKLEDVTSSIKFFPIKNDPSKLTLKFVDDGVTYFFKANSQYSYDQNEVLATILLKNIGIKTNGADFACFVIEDNKRNGIVSKDIVENRKNVEVITYDHIHTQSICIDYSVDFIYNNVSAYCEDNNIKLDENFRDDLAVHALAYYLTGQQDFNYKNVEFAIESTQTGKKILSLLPIVDKSIVFFSVVAKNGNPFNHISLETIKENPKKQTHALQYDFMFETELLEACQHSRVVRELAVNVLHNKKLEKILKKVANFDFKTAIKDYMKNNPNFKFDIATVQKAIIFFENNREDLVNTIKRIDEKFFAQKDAKNFNKQNNNQNAVLNL